MAPSFATDKLHLAKPTQLLEITQQNFQKIKVCCRELSDKLYKEKTLKFKI